MDFTIITTQIDETSRKFSLMINAEKPQQLQPNQRNIYKYQQTKRSYYASQTICLPRRANWWNL